MGVKRSLRKLGEFQGIALRIGGGIILGAFVGLVYGMIPFVTQEDILFAIENTILGTIAGTPDMICFGVLVGAFIGALAHPSKRSIKEVIIGIIVGQTLSLQATSFWIRFFG